jgi:hypothetical protein
MTKPKTKQTGTTHNQTNIHHTNGTKTKPPKWNHDKTTKTKPTKGSNNKLSKGTTTKGRKGNQPQTPKGKNIKDAQKEPRQNSATYELLIRIHMMLCHASNGVCYSCLRRDIGIGGTLSPSTIYRILFKQSYAFII